MTTPVPAPFLSLPLPGGVFTRLGAQRGGLQGQNKGPSGL